MVARPLDDAPSLEIRHFCDSGMKCFGEHGLFQQLAPFLHRNTAVKLYSSGKTFKSLVKGKFSGLLLRLAMTSLIEEKSAWKLPHFDHIDPRFWRRRIQNEQVHLRIMHQLTRVLQNGLNLHRREPGATMVWSRYYVNQPLENGTPDGRCGICLPSYVKPSWHLTWHNVGILMATREQYANAMASRRRLDLERICLDLVRQRIGILMARVQQRPALQYTHPSSSFAQ